MLLDVLSKHFVFGGHSEGGDFANDVFFLSCFLSETGVQGLVQGVWDDWPWCLDWRWGRQWRLPRKGTKEWISNPAKPAKLLTYATAKNQFCGGT